jgi:CheY-like chemotaxis protein
MYRIVCFTDNAAVARIVQQRLTDQPCNLQFLPASRLTDELRNYVRRFAPDMLLFELSPTLDNLSLFFFLRADQATRHIPVVMITPSAQFDQYAQVLGANACISRTLLSDRLLPTISHHLVPIESAVAAA